MQAIKMLGLVTLELETELEESWDIVKKTNADLEEVTDKRDVTE